MHTPVFKKILKGQSIHQANKSAAALLYRAAQGPAGHAGFIRIAVRLCMAHCFGRKWHPLRLNGVAVLQLHENLSSRLCPCHLSGAAVCSCDGTLWLLPIVCSELRSAPVCESQITNLPVYCVSIVFVMVGCLNSWNLATRAPAACGHQRQPILQSSRLSAPSRRVAIHSQPFTELKAWQRKRLEAAAELSKKKTNVVLLTV